MGAEKLIDNITEQIEIINQHKDLSDFSGDTLSRVGVRLAAYKAGLGRHLTSAKKDTWVAEKALKEAKAHEFKRLRQLGNSATDSNEMKILGVEQEYSNLIEAQELEDKLNTLSFNVHDLIDSIKSRLINLQYERAENNVS